MKKLTEVLPLMNYDIHELETWVIPNFDFVATNGEKNKKLSFLSDLNPPSEPA